MHMLFLKLGWRTLQRDLRAGQLHLLILAVTLAVAALTSVHFFADRLKAGLERDATQLLGGDVVINSDNPAPPAFTAQAQTRGLVSTLSLSFPTMGRAADADGAASKLVSLKAVTQGYPLKGQLRIASAPDASEQTTRAVPAPGTVWVDAGLLDALDLSVGKPLLLGNTRLQITQIITQEPDRGAGFMNFAPRVMLNMADLDTTGLVQPASRVTYRLAFAGDAAKVQGFLEWTQAEIKKTQMRGMRVESLQTGRPEMQQTLERAEKFLGLVAMLAALLSAVAVSIVARGFANQHLNDCALLRVLGLSQKTIAWAYTVEFVGVGLLASSAGVLLGFTVHYVLVALLAGLVTATLPAATWWPALQGMAMGLTLLITFGLPPILQLAHVPPLRVLRRELGALKTTTWATMALGLAGFAALLLATSSDLRLGLITVGGFAGAVLVFALVSVLAIRLLRKVVNEATSPRWLVLATRQICARPAYAAVQISALAVGLLALILLILLRTDLISSWRQSTPVDAPNRFVINIQPEQSTAFQQALRDAGIKRYDWYPMLRGRLVAINGKAVRSDDFSEGRAQRLVDREFNLSYNATQPAHNTLVAGRWVAEEKNAISVEAGLATTLGLKLGDRLQFDLAGQTNEATITSLRKVDWAGMRANFFVMYPVSELPNLPVSYISAFKAPTTPPSNTLGTTSNSGLQRKTLSPSLDNRLVRAFPNITSVDMTSTLRQIQQVVDQVIHAVEFLFGFTLAAGLLVLFAALTATSQERRYEFAIMRSLGASTSLLRQIQWAELAGVGLLAGLLASASASLVGWALAYYVFDFVWTASWLALPLGSLAGAGLALAAGWWGLRGLVHTPVMETLRRVQ